MQSSDTRRKARSTPDDGIAELTFAGTGIDALLRRELRTYAKGRSAGAYHMLEYFLGFRNEKLVSIATGRGKRFRAALCLYLADCYGARDKAKQIALAIELFHNFTLIHDDIADGDEVRRGKPTLWKRFGFRHALNAGDIQLILALEASVFVAKAGSMESVAALLKSFREVCEGQYLDFEFTDKAIARVSEEEYMHMIYKKAGVLLGVSAETAGIVADCSKIECSNLKKFGDTLGVAYQMADDFRSIWATQEKTGKDIHSDIRERKRTLPLILAYRGLSAKDKRLVSEMYAVNRALSKEEVEMMLALIAKTSAKEEVLKRIEAQKKIAKNTIEKLSLSGKAKRVLGEIVDAFTVVA
jgi:geranylgeranyl diphosphate synthase type I